MPKIQASSSPTESPAVYAVAGAHHYRFIGIEFKPKDGSYVNRLVALGSGNETSADVLPYDIIIDRCYLHGDPAEAQSWRGIQRQSPGGH